MRLMICIAFCLITFKCHSCHCDKCSRDIPQAPALANGTDYTVLDSRLATEDSDVFERLLKEHVRKYSNIAGSVFVFPDGSSKTVYRSAYLSESPETIKELVQERGVKTMINFYRTPRFDVIPWVDKERALFEEYGGDHYIFIPDFDYDFKSWDEELAVLNKIASIIQLICVAEGNVVIHCMGGEHRSGIIYGILHKCFHQLSIEVILQEYKCHCGWKSDSEKGGLKQSNVDLIKDFPVEWFQKTL